MLHPPLHICVPRQRYGTRTPIQTTEPVPRIESDERKDYGSHFAPVPVSIYEAIGQSVGGTLWTPAANASCCTPQPRTTPSLEENFTLGVIHGVLLWAGMNAATPPGAGVCGGRGHKRFERAVADDAHFVTELLAPLPCCRRDEYTHRRSATRPTRAKLSAGLASTRRHVMGCSSRQTTTTTTTATIRQRSHGTRRRATLPSTSTGQ